MQIKKILYRPLSFLYSTICYLIPTNNKKIVFMSYPDVADNSWHMYQHLLKSNKGYKYVWVCRDIKYSKEKVGGLGADGSTSICSFVSIAAAYHFLTSGYVFHSCGTYFFVRRSKGPVIVNLWHGMPIKAIAFLDNKKIHEVPFSDYTIATSDFFSNVMSAAFDIKKENILIANLPRNDRLANPSVDKGYVNARIGGSKDARLIAWLPTFRVSRRGCVRRDSKSTSFLDDWSDSDLDRLNLVAKSKNLYLVIKLHYLDELNEAENLPGYSNIKLYRDIEWQALDIELYDLLAFSEALISDVSSVIIDYLSTGKPICVINSGIEDYTRDLVAGLDKDYIRKTFYTAYSLSDMISFVSSPDRFSPGRFSIEKLVSFDEGHMSSCKNIEEFLKL